MKAASYLRFLTFGMVAIWSLCFATFARGEGIDPFALENERTPSKVQPKIISSSERLAKAIQFHVSVNPKEAKPGDVVQLVIVGKPAPGWHTYPITQRTSDQRESMLSKLTLAPSTEVKPLYPIKESAPKAVSIGKEAYLELVGEFTWTQDLLVLPEAVPGSKKIGVTIHLVACTESQCLDPANYAPLFAELTVKPGEAVALSAALQDRLKQGPKIDVVTANAVAEGESDLSSLLGTAFFGAFFMLLTPCVFPMIPITVNFFLKQSEKEHHRPLLMASVYSATIILLLSVVMLLLGNAVIALSVAAWFNLAMGLVLVVFALSLFGMYELELPHFVARYTSAREGQGGLLGAIFMALTFTVTSFTCTGPFIGAMLAQVSMAKPNVAHLMLAALVYSTTFAAPFFVLALFPSLIKKLPKSGSWLNSVKITMGFLEIAAALKFLANADITWHQGDARLFNFDTVLCGWIALSFASAFYLYGLFRLPHDDRVESIGVLRLMAATMSFGLAIYMVPALFGTKPQGAVMDAIIAFLPQKLESNAAAALGGRVQDSNRLTWHLDYADAWKEAKDSNKLIFVDFTGIVCTNCRDNENNVFPRPEVRSELEKYARVQLYTDTVPNKLLSELESSEQAQRNAAWRNAVGNPTNPYYVILRPGASATILENGTLNAQVIERWEQGTIRDVASFVRMLQRPFETQLSMAP